MQIAKRIGLFRQGVQMNCFDVFNAVTLNNTVDMRRFCHPNLAMTSVFFIKNFARLCRGRRGRPEK
jgi:hypothetical protein